MTGRSVPSIRDFKKNIEPDVGAVILDPAPPPPPRQKPNTSLMHIHVSKVNIDVNECKRTCHIRMPKKCKVLSLELFLGGLPPLQQEKWVKAEARQNKMPDTLIKYLQNGENDFSTQIDHPIQFQKGDLLNIFMSHNLGNTIEVRDIDLCIEVEH